jgi:hypothetical protein
MHFPLQLCSRAGPESCPNRIPDIFDGVIIDAVVGLSNGCNGRLWRLNRKPICESAGRRLKRTEDLDIPLAGCLARQIECARDLRGAHNNHGVPFFSRTVAPATKFVPARFVMSTVPLFLPDAGVIDVTVGTGLSATHSCGAQFAVHWG